MIEQEKIRREHLEKLLKKGENPYQIQNIQCKNTIEDILSIKNSDESTWDQNDVSFIARIISIRQSFATVRYNNKDLQIYIPKKLKDLSDYYTKFVDLGDWVYVYGNCFKTKIGEFSIKVSDLKIISKCLNPFPSQHYGINSDDQIYKNRVGLALSNQSFLENFYKRNKIIWEIRKYLTDNLGYIEVETPILEHQYGGANAVPFKTYCQSLKKELFLRIATEISLKKMIISGFPKIYELGKVFRNEGIDATHNPEFTSLEIYTVNASFDELMDLPEGIIMDLATKFSIEEIEWNENKLNLSKKFNRVSMNELVKLKTGLDFYSGSVSLNDAILMAKKMGLELFDFEKTKGHIMYKIFDNLISPKLIEPTFVYGFPKEVSPLSKLDPANSDFTLRYELFIGGMEFANGFMELNDPDDQLLRFQNQQKQRESGDKEAFELDENFIFCLKYGMPPTAGVGVGIDRLVMLLLKIKSIKTSLFFPLTSFR